MDEDQTWRITDFGNVRQFSRDGSIHATDEVFNAASHLAALILSILGSAILIVGASAQGEPWKIVSFSIYGASLMFLFGSSTLHHAIEGPWEEFLRMLDYFAIYPLIAGTFTPLCLVFYHQDPVGWTFCGTIWGLALVGMILTASCIARVPKWFSMTLYITLGWLGACFTYWVGDIKEKCMPSIKKENNAHSHTLPGPTGVSRDLARLRGRCSGSSLDAHVLLRSSVGGLNYIGAAQLEQLYLYRVC
eukprot:scaffold34593_cov179-Amphora_coffeaeformis.AAC.3